MKGVAASPGIVIGQAHVLKEYPIHIDQQPIAAEQVEAELQKFEEALVKAKSQLEIIRDKAKKEMGADKAEIFGAHLMMLEDEVFLGEIREKIKSESLRAEYALTLVVAAYTEMFQNMEDEYLKERAADIQDVSDRLVKNLLNIPMQSLADLAEEVVIIARDLTPSDTAQMNKECVMAFATEMGGRTSHTAIMARSLEIPAVVGCVGLLAEVQNGDLVIVDGNKGLVFLNPDQDTLEQYRKAQEEYARYIQELKELKDLPAETNDQARRVELVANIGTPKDCAGALANGAEGIGLYRTEFLSWTVRLCPAKTNSLWPIKRWLKK